MRPRQLLHHLPLGTTTFAAASHLQTLLTARHLLFKSSPTTSPLPPPPVLITAEFSHPVYTLGRRQHSPTPEELSHLRADGRALVVATPRGGETTYHGPGQLTAYLITDLKLHRLSARSYVMLLERAVMDTLLNYGIVGMRTKDPGVWVNEEEKICALGVQMRRSITSYGIGLNVGESPMEWFERIVPCGLQGKRAGCMLREGVTVETNEVARVLARCVSGGLGLEVVETVPERVLGAVGQREWERLVREVEKVGL